jgi:hypothetical protein
VLYVTYKIESEKQAMGSNLTEKTVQGNKSHTLLGFPSCTRKGVVEALWSVSSRVALVLALGNLTRWGFVGLA